MERLHQSVGAWVCVNFLPRVDKVEDTQSLGQGGSQALCIQYDVVMQES